MINRIIEIANEKENFQEACYYIVSELEKLIPNWDKREKVINQIELDYNVRLVY